MEKEITKKRLEAIDAELKELRSKQSKLKEKWEKEKSAIKEIRSAKSQLEEYREEAERFEREGQLEKVAEIRYGLIPNTREKLEKLNANLQEMQKENKLLNEEVGADDIAEIVAKATGIPVSRMMETEKMKLLTMTDKLKESVIGQDEAALAISNAIRRSRAGLQDENRPIGSFIFLGTTGIGKTEMAKALASFLFDDVSAMVRIDMSEYSEKFAVSRLIGAPPGYVGYDQGGQLTDAIRQRPYSVILLDEIEKAHPEIFNVLLQVLDEGRLTDSQGKTVDFKNTIIIMTSNLGTEFIQSRLKEINTENKAEILSDVRGKVMETVRKHMKPEFLNRIDEILLFNPLDEEKIIDITRLRIKKLTDRIFKNTKVRLNVTEEAIKWLSKLGYDPQYGARPLDRAIQKHISNPLSKKLLEGGIAENSIITVDTDENGKFSFD
ncbi:MAG: hypothetical protein Kapaf2KO_05510 [Candidatus Kapaibacteriales bacterium]